MGNDPTITNKAPATERPTASTATGPDLSAATFVGTDIMDQPEARTSPLTSETFEKKWAHGISFPDTGTTISIDIRKGAKAA